MQAAEAKVLVTFGRSMRSFRKQRKMTQDDLAVAARLSRNYVSDIERGVRNPTLWALIRLSRALRISLCTLLEDFC